MTAGVETRVGSLYVHVPFCARKCEYCAFYSEAAKGETVLRYVEALIRELELVAPRLRPRPDSPPLATIFFGGGTPSLLTLPQWTRVFQAMDRLGLKGASEWTIECNPATVSLDKARLWREHGVTRVSMGVQSLDGALLDRLGRVHSRAMAFQSFDTLRQAGFDNLNVDLMFGIPGQTMEVWKSTLDEALAFGSEHLSSYEVIYEEDTPLFAQMQAGEFDVDEALSCAMYEELIERAAGAGLRQYEVANFARERRVRSVSGSAVDAKGSGPSASSGLNGGRHPREASGCARRCEAGNSAACAEQVPTLACRHNLNYWHGGSYFGLGPSAAGYVDGVRTRNWSNTQLYCEQLERGRRAVEWSEALPPLQRAGEIAAFGLRTNVGWRFEQFQGLTGFDLRAEWTAELGRLVELGWAHQHREGLHLTRRGLRFADAAAEMFLR